MGRGNYLPPMFDELDMGDKFKMVYVDHRYNQLDELEVELDADRIRDVLDEVSAALPTSFIPVEEWIHLRGSGNSRDFLFAENDYAQVIIGYEDDYMAICVCAKEKRRGKGYYSQFSRTADKVFKHLWRAGYDMRVRTSCWTSGKYEPEFKPIGVRKAALERGAVIAASLKTDTQHFSELP